MKRVLVAGEINVDLILKASGALPALGKEILVDDAVLTLGSASAICAVGLARLGTPVSFVGKVGADPWGDFCLDTMRAAGIAPAGGLTPSLDPGFDPRERWGADIVDALREVDVFFPNEVELSAISGTADVS